MWSTSVLGLWLCALRVAVAVVRRRSGAARWCGAVRRCGAVVVRRCCVPGRGLLGHDGLSRLAAVRCRSPAVLRLRTVATVRPRCAGLAVCWLVCCCCVGYCGVPVVPVIGVRRRAHHPKPFFVVAFTFWLCFGRGRGGVSGQVEAGCGLICRTSSARDVHEPPPSTSNPYQHTYARTEPRTSVPQHVAYVHVCAAWDSVQPGTTRDKTLPPHLSNVQYRWQRGRTPLLIFFAKSISSLGFSSHHP